MSAEYVTQSALTPGGSETAINTTSPDTTDGTYVIVLDLSNMVDLDIFELRVKEKALSGGTQRLVKLWTFANAQAEPIFVSRPITLLHGWDITLKQTAGSNRAVDCSIRRFNIEAADVWSVTTRTLTSFGTLAADVWAVGTRTLTSFGTLAADVWAVGTRSLTTFGTLAADTATAVWAAGTRSLTTFGTLAADTATAVWAAGTRSLTTFGTLAADVWAVATRTITSSPSDILSAASTLLSAIGTRAAPGDAMTLTSGERTSIGTAVWASTTRTLSSFGTLVADVAAAVWAAGTRTLTSLASVVADVQTGLTNQGYTAARAVYLDKLPTIDTATEIVRKIQKNKVVINGSDTLVTVYNDDGTTVAFTFTTTADGRSRTPN